jgi:hypothetical protein
MHGHGNNSNEINVLRFQRQRDIAQQILARQKFSDETSARLLTTSFLVTASFLDVDRATRLEQREVIERSHRAKS